MDAGRFPAAMTTTSWFNHIHLNTPTVAAGLGGVGVCVGCDPYSGLTSTLLVSVNHAV